MNLFVANERYDLIYLLGFIREFEHQTTNHFLIPEDLHIPNRLRELLQKSNCSIVNITDASKEHYEKIVIHSYSNWATHQEMLLRFNYNEVIFYSDMDIAKKKKCFMELSESLYRSKQVLDQEINFSSCVCKLQDIISS